MGTPVVALLAVLLAAGCADTPKGGPAADRGLVGRAHAEVDAALSDDDEIVRCHGLEVLAAAPPGDVDVKLTTALNDRSPLVRKAAAITIGRLQRKSFAGKFKPLLDDDASLPPNSDGSDHIAAYQERLAAIFAMHRLGDSSLTKEFQQGLLDSRPAVRRDAVFLLGLLGEPSAIPWLVKRLHDDEEPHARIQAAEALWRLHDVTGQTALINATVAGDGTLQMEAALALAEPRDSRVVGNVEGMFNADYPEVRLVAARAAGMLGSTKGYKIAAAAAGDKDPMHRALAAFALGDIGKVEGLPILSKLLDDAVPEVRIAAAQGVLTISHDRATTP